jgi:hypothetical protein
MYTNNADGAWTPVNSSSNQQKGYYNNESVEGGGLFGGKCYWNILGNSSQNFACPNQSLNRPYAVGAFYSTSNYEYFAPTYDLTAITLTVNLNRYTVMRSDRLPTSSTVQNGATGTQTGFGLHQNDNFAVFTAKHPCLNRILQFYR